MDNAKSKKVNHFTFEHRLKNRETRFIDVYSSPVMYNKKDVLLSIMFDVSERELLNKALIETRDLLKKSQILLEASLNSSKGIIILSLDMDYKYLFYNETHKSDMKIAYGDKERKTYETY